MLGVLAAEIHLMPDWTVIVQMGIFLSALAVLSFLVFRPTLRIIDRRRGYTEEARAEAERIGAEADRIEEERRTSIAAAIEEAGRERDERTARARRDAEGAIAEAKQQAQRLIDSTAVSRESSERAAEAGASGEGDAIAEEIVRRVAPSP